MDKLVVVDKEGMIFEKGFVHSNADGWKQRE